MKAGEGEIANNRHQVQQRQHDQHASTSHDRYQDPDPYESHSETWQSAPTRSPVTT
jgi:hypothetical protein